MRLLVTRPLHQAAATVAALEDDGHSCIVSPMLERHWLDLPRPGGHFDIVVLTSRNAVDGLVRQWPGVMKGRKRGDLPVFAVGDATKEAAVNAGFVKTVSCKGSAIDLVQQVVQAWGNGFSPDTPGKPGILYPCALRPSHDLPALFEEHELTCAAWPVYAMEEAETLTPEALQALNSATLDGVLVYSARSVKVFARLVTQSGVATRLPTIFTLSGNICAALTPDLAASCLAAKEPNEAALRLLLSQHEN